MSLYKVGCHQPRTGLIYVQNPSALQEQPHVGASQEQTPKNDKMTVLVVLGLTAVIYLGIPLLNKAKGV